MVTACDPLSVAGGWPGVLRRLAGREDLGSELAEAALDAVMAGGVSDARISGFIVAMRMKGESSAELIGMVRSMLKAATPLDLPDGCIDIVGTGGSPSRQRHALNVSTMACFVAAAAGAVVCKHGNVRASSTSGSFDLLDALGVPVETDPGELAAGVRSRGIGFAYARALHPAMRHVAGVRGQLGIPTVFNILGPLSHPGRVKRQVVGVADPARAHQVAEVLAANGSQRAMVVHGEGGLDELTTAGVSHVVELRDGAIDSRVELRDGAIDSFEVNPVELGLPLAGQEDLRGGSPEDNAAIFQDILAGETGPRRDIVVLNAAAGLVVAGLADSLSEGVAAAAAAIDDGRAATLLKRVRSG